MSCWIREISQRSWHFANPRLRPRAWSCWSVWIGRSLVLAWTVSLLQAAEALPRRFIFPDDTFAFNNELEWEYRPNPTNGELEPTPRVPPPTFSLRCFTIARSARQFYENARFAPEEPKATPASYRFWIRRVFHSDPRKKGALGNKVVIPGYANLRDFSADNAELLKSESGGAWRSFVQRGNWRMVFPFSRCNQERTAQRLARKVQEDRLAVLHLVRLPSWKLNHAMLLTEVEVKADQFEFTAYDPNQSDAPIRVTYDRAARQFYLPRTIYFAGGRVNVYEVYWSCLF